MSTRERYRGHLILVKGHQEPDSDRWKGSVHVQFNEDNLSFRDVQIPDPPARFATEKNAEKYALKVGKKWVDDRVRQAEVVDLTESHWRLSLRSSIWFTVAIISFCVIGLLAAYVQRPGVLERVFDDVDAVTSDWIEQARHSLSKQSGRIYNTKRKEILAEL